MRTRFTLAQMSQRGYCLGDIDHMIQKKMAEYSCKSGAVVLNIPDIMAVDSYFNELAEKKKYRR